MRIDQEMWSDYLTSAGEPECAAEGTYEIKKIRGKGKKVKDGDGCAWETDASGRITTYGNDWVAELWEPEPYSD